MKKMKALAELRRKKMLENYRREMLPIWTAEVAQLLGLNENDVEFLEMEEADAMVERWRADPVFLQTRKSPIYYREWTLQDVEAFQEFLRLFKTHAPNLKMLYTRYGAFGYVRIDLHRLIDHVFNLIEGIDLEDPRAITEDGYCKIEISATEQGDVYGRQVYYMMLYGECWKPVLAALGESLTPPDRRIHGKLYPPPSPSQSTE